MGRAQKNVRLSDATIDKLRVLGEAYGTETEAVAVAIEHLYQHTLEEQSGVKPYLDEVREKLLGFTAGSRVEFRWTPGQRVSEIPDWVDVHFKSQEAKEMGLRALKTRRIPIHPVSEVGIGLFVTVRPIDVSKRTV